MVKVKTKIQLGIKEILIEEIEKHLNSSDRNYKFIEKE